jgi:hypothetical protein
MINNIKITGNINNINRLSRLKLEDENLLFIENKNQYFGFEGDYIEHHIYDINMNLIDSIYSYNDYKLPTDSYLSFDSKLPSIEIDPINDLQKLGYTSGQFISQYNFQNTKTSPTDNVFIEDISSDRTEIKINSTLLTTLELDNIFTTLINKINSSDEQKYLLFNFINNYQNLIINLAINNNSFLIKLYEPLPEFISTKDIIWITEEITEPYLFNLDLNTLIYNNNNINKLKGPNFDIEIDIKQNIASQYEDYSSLISNLTGSSYNNILGYINDKSYDLNIDYTLFNNFIHFSSANGRLNIFHNKIKQIEDYNTDITYINSSNSILKTQQVTSVQNNINKLIQNFDGFEKYLYFESSSYTWPKQNSTKPYTLLSTSSLYVNNWYNNYTSSAKLYDEENLDYLYNIIPNYIKNDNNYQPYFTFVDMIGHYFDNIWIYIKSLNEIKNADNNLGKGISKDIVYDALKSLGIKLYNSSINKDINLYIDGGNEGNNIFNDDFSLNDSYLNNIPKKDILSEMYKRIYHNIPLLNKTKGTQTGLKNLISTFGISSSILEPKEFGGLTKNEYINEFNNNKINIINNDITGSVLSPFISLNLNPTASNELKNYDSNIIDISFSPQNELNNRISSSLSIVNSNFNIGQYIGDPRNLYSSSYEFLDELRTEHYITSGSINTQLDYKGFFELITYFDNSLFKMLKDFTPARNKVLTGITIKSSLLERNKIKSTKPSINEETVHNLVLQGPTILEDNNYHYKYYKNKTNFYNGDISGSYINVYKKFEENNYNPYLINPNEFNENEFKHSKFNILLNNISSSLLSSFRFKLEKIHTINNNKVYDTPLYISSSAELQDSYETLYSHQNSRYNGTKLYSNKFNDYTPPSLDYQGDKSFGKTSVINHNTIKIGLFTQITDSSKYFEFPKRSNVRLKYLVDENGNLTELNKRNEHWFEIQNIFKLGNTSTVTLFDNQKYSDQKKTDGNKNIYSSGYSYFPILYNSGSDNKLYFNYAEDSFKELFKISNSGGFIRGSSTLAYPLTSGKIYNIFDITTPSKDNPIEGFTGNNLFSNNGVNTFSTYSISENGNQKFNTDFNVNIKFSNISQSGSFIFNINKVGTGIIASQTLSATSSYSSNIINSTNLIACSIDNNPLTLSQKLNILNEDGSIESTLNQGDLIYKVIPYQIIFPGCYGQGIYNQGLYVTETYYNTIQTFYSDPSTNISCNNIYILPTYNKKLFTMPVIDLESTLNFNLSTNYNSYIKGDKIGFEFITGSGGFNNGNFTASISNGGVLYNQLNINQIGNNPYASNITSPFISGSSSSNEIILNTELSAFKDYLYTPSGSSILMSDISPLYNSYGDVDYKFSPKLGDVVIIYYGSQNSYLESTILSINEINNKMHIKLTNNLPGALSIPVYSNSTINKFLILSKLEDETNIILNIDKPDGITSLGFIIPNNIHKDILNNIDIITKEIKQKLIDSGDVLSV